MMKGERFGPMGAAGPLHSTHLRCVLPPQEPSPGSGFRQGDVDITAWGLSSWEFGVSFPPCAGANRRRAAKHPATALGHGHALTQLGRRSSREESGREKKKNERTVE